MQIYKYSNQYVETQFALSRLIGIAMDSDEFQDALISSGVEILEVTVPEYDSSVQQLDIESGEKTDGVFVYGIKPKTKLVVFDDTGSYIKHGWSDEAVDVPLPLVDFVDNQYKFVDGNVVPPSMEYLRKQLKASVVKFANDKRIALITMTDSTPEEREWWPEFSQQAIRFKNGNPTDEDVTDFTLEAEKRGKGETAEELALKTFAKSRLYNIGGRTINGLKSKAIDELTNAKDEIPALFTVISKLKNEANIEFAALKSQFGG